MRPSRRRQRSRTKRATKPVASMSSSVTSPAAGRPVDLVPRGHEQRRQQQAIEPMARSVVIARLPRPRARRARRAPVTRPPPARAPARVARCRTFPRRRRRAHRAQCAAQRACLRRRDARRCAAATTQRRPSCAGPERTGRGGRPSTSSYAMRGRSTPQARARPCHCQRRGLTSISLKRPSRGSSRNSVCAMPWWPSAAEQRERLLDRVVAPARLAHTAGAEAARHLHELASAEEPERRYRPHPCRSRRSRASRPRQGSTSCSIGRCPRQPRARPRSGRRASGTRSRAGRSGA